MWQRRTFHECAEELEMVSQSFRTAFTNCSGIEQQRREEILRDSSKEGVAILKVLALSIRPEQDYDEEFKKATQDITVGALKRSASNNDVSDAINSYRPPYSKIFGFEQLGLREALNKIAHADPDPSKNGFFADNVFHDLILSGKDKKGKTWIAVVSIVDLCRAVKLLPDQNLQNQAI
jgi:hypothetical protein